MNKELGYCFKIIIIGDKGTGKSNFLKRLSPTPTYDWDKPPIGADFSIFSYELDQQMVKLFIGDTSGDPRFRRRIFSRLQGVHDLLMVYDIANRKTFENVRNWIRGAKEWSDNDVTMVLVGNKSDLEEEREVSYEEGRLLAEEYGMKFVETSTKKNDNIHSLAKWLMKQGIEKDVIQKKYLLEKEMEKDMIQKKYLAEKEMIQKKYLSENHKGKDNFSSKCFST